MNTLEPQEPRRITSGIPGLDEILFGGLPAHRTYLLRGRSGSGKTTFAMQFILEGVRQGEKVLYVMLTETRQELQEVVASHGWSMEGVSVHEVVEGPERLMREAESTLFHPSENELGDTVRDIVAVAQELHPARIVIDPLSELQVMAAEPKRFRMQFLALKQLFADIGTTALLVEETPNPSETGGHLENVAHGILHLDQQCPSYGTDRRRVRITKLRGSPILGGYHDLDLLTGGMVVYPRLHHIGDSRYPPMEVASTAIPSLDTMLGGGIDGGTHTLVVGRPGTGKSSLIAHLVSALSREGVFSSVYLFDESSSLFARRSESLGIPLESRVESGRMTLKQFHPGEMSPGRLSREITTAVMERGVGAVVLDSLGGLARSMYDEPLLNVRLRELFVWLSGRGVITFTALQTGDLDARSCDISYLADTVLLLGQAQRDFDLMKTIAVVKRRGGAHENSVRELKLTPAGIAIGDRLRDLSCGELWIGRQNGWPEHAPKAKLASEPADSPRE